MNRLDYYFKQKVTEAELDKGFKYAEDAIKAVAAESGLFGVSSGMVLSAQLVPDMSVAVSDGVAYDKAGNPVRVVSVPPVSVAIDYNAIPTTVAGGANEKYVSIFVEFDRALSDPRTDGNSLTVFFERQEFYKFKIVQSAEALIGAAVPVAVDPSGGNGVLLGTVHLLFGQSTVANADISQAARDDVYYYGSWGVTPAPISVRVGTARAAIGILQGAINTLFGGGGPTIPASSIAYAGGAAWADGTTNPAASVEAQLDKIINDLRATVDPAGAKKIGARAQTSGGHSVSSTTIDGQILELLAYIDGIGAAGSIAYAGGGAWADSSTNPATTVENQLDKIIADLGGANGAQKVGAPGYTSVLNQLAAGSVQTQVAQILGVLDVGAKRIRRFSNLGALNAYNGPFGAGVLDGECAWVDDVSFGQGGKALWTFKLGSVYVLVPRFVIADGGATGRWFRECSADVFLDATLGVATRWGIPVPNAIVAMVETQYLGGTASVVNTGSFVDVPGVLSNSLVYKQGDVVLLDVFGTVGTDVGAASNFAEIQIASFDGATTLVLSGSKVSFQPDSAVNRAGTSPFSINLRVSFGADIASLQFLPQVRGPAVGSTRFVTPVTFRMTQIRP